MESEFDGQNSIVLSDTDNINCDITLHSETPKPLLSSTAQKRNVNNNSSRFDNNNLMKNNQNSRGSYIPRPKVSLSSSRTQAANNRSSTGSSISLKSENSSFKDDSSLSILDLNEISDARSSASLVHIKNKTSSIGSWLDSCLPEDDGTAQLVSVSNISKNDTSQIEISNFYQLQRSEAFDFAENSMDFKIPSQDIEPTSEVPVMPAMPKSPFGSDESINSEFEFDEAELDLDGLINEDDGELDQTMKASNENLEVEQQEYNRTQNQDAVAETQESKAQRQDVEIPTEHSNDHATTMDFLRGLGLPQFQKEQDSDPASPFNLSKMDSKYFAQMSMQSMEDESRTFNASQSQSEPLASLSYQQAPEETKQVDFSGPSGVDVFDGRANPFVPARTSTVDTDGYDNWQCNNPLDFSATEFQNDSKMQRDIFGEEQFLSGNINAILDKEEESFMKEHQFSLDENFQAPDQNENLHEFSTYRTSILTMPDDDAGKVSIGTYMGERSAKLGNWNEDKPVERPSFGLKVRTPSPQKPCKLLSQSTVSSDESKTSPSDQKPTPHKPPTGAAISNDTQLPSVLELDDTVDKSMMNSLSNAISNMSSSMNNEELAKFIVALSNRKLEEQKQRAVSKETFVVPTSDSSAKLQKSPAASVHDVSSNQTGVTKHSLSHDDSKSFVAVQDSTLVSDTLPSDSTMKADDAKIPENVKRLSDALSNSSASSETSSKSIEDKAVSQPEKKAKSPVPSEDSQASEVVKAPVYQTDELPSLPNNDTIFSTDSVNSHFLSSTRANLSLTRGSLSRESIENLHKKLRVRLDGKDVHSDAPLPDLVTNKTTQSSVKSASYNDLEKAHKKLDDADLKSWKLAENVSGRLARPSVDPLSQSSPEKHDFTKWEKLDDTNLSRLSSAFHHLLPSTSFNEMATVAESDFHQQHLPTDHLDTIQEEESEKRASLESVGSSKHEISSCSSVEPIPKASSTKYDGDLSQASRSSSDRLSGISASVPPQMLSSQFMVRPPVDAGHPEHPLYPPYYSGPSVLPPHLAAYMSGPGDLYHRMHPNLSMPPMPVSLGSYGPGYMVDSRSFDSTVFSARSHPSHSYPTMLPYPSHHSASVMSCPQDRRMYQQQPEFYDSASPISIPGELAIEKVLCVGVPGKAALPIKNTSARWIQMELRPISVTVNRQSAPHVPESYVTVKRKHVIGPHSVEHTDVTVVGHVSGRCDVILEVTSHPIAVEGGGAPDPRCHVTTLNVRASIEAPSVILFGSPELPRDQRSRSIAFGEVVYGATKCLPLRILNQAKVETPVRLVVYSGAPDRASFSLSLTSAPTTRQDASSGGMSILQSVLAIGPQPTTVWIHLNSSSRHFPAGEKPQPVEARIEVILDAPFKPQDGSSGSSQVQTALDSIVVSAVLGVGKLHAPRSQQALCFKTAKGSQQNKSFPVKNAGNITVQVEFLVQAHCDHFSTTPTSAVLPPGGDIELTVEFAPPQNTHLKPGGEAVSTLVLMNILPSGPQFEVKVSGNLADKPARTSIVSAAPTSLLTNKTRLRWGGVAIGESMRQKLMLRSGPCENPFSFRASIKGDTTNSFQVVTSETGCEELSARCDMMITPGQDKAINILFAPSRQKMVNAKLEIKTPVDDLPATKYTIPLSGYGGKSKISVEGLELSDTKGTPLHNNFHPEMFVLNMKNRSTGADNFVVRNTGSRMAFVKFVSYEDSTCKLVTSEVTCHPAQFVLQERQSRTVAIRSSDKEAAKSCFLSIWNGDELARQMLKITLRKQPSTASLVNRYVPQTFAYLRTVPFDGIFEGEDSNAEEELQDHEPHSFDVQIFYANVRQSAIEIVTKQPQPDLLSLTGSDQSKAPKAVTKQLPIEAERDVQYLLSKLTSRNQVPAKSAEVTKDSSFALNWDVSPAHLTLATPPSKGSGRMGVPEASRVKIVNRSMASLVYDVVWPGHYLTITPNRGRVEPESVSILLISANPSLAGRKELLPWCGQAMVVATGSGPGGCDNTRVIHLQIKSEDEPEIDSVSSSRTSGISSDECASLSAPQQPLLRVTSHVIDFDDVAVGASGKSHLEFRNMSKSDTKWVLTSFAPAYVKNTDATGDVFRSTYAAFVFAHSSGRLEPGARIQVPVTFNPMNPGMYTQHWEIEYHEVTDGPALTLQRAKISLQGQCLKAAPSRRPAVPSSASRKTTKSDIYISENSYTFDRIAVGQTSLLKIPIKNKGKTAHTVKFVNIRPPFHTAHLKHTVRSMHCANLPITFKPTSVGSFTGTLVVQTETGDAINVTLKATAC